MKKKRKRKLKFKKIIPIIIFVLLANIIVSLFISNKNNTLKSIGYNKQEISAILKNVSNKYVDILEEYNYISNIKKIVQDKEFKEENLKSYLDYLKDNQDISPSHLILLVNNNLTDKSYDETIKEILNNSNMNSKLLTRYINYYNLYKLKSDYVIKAVNNNIDKMDIIYDDVIDKLINDSYFKLDNLDRYLEYYKDHSSLSAKEIITRVNSNLDYAFYTNTMPTDTSKGFLMIVNKYYYLSEDYSSDSLVNVSSSYGSGQLDSTVYNAFIEMYNAANKENLHLMVASPYRSYKRQYTLYHNYAAEDGYTLADTYSARPGFSEHQTGLAIDIGARDTYGIELFGNTDEFKWIKDNAHLYGFILRYPKGKEYITGYKYEPWHYRYVGVEAAKYIYENNITFEEYYEYFVK